LDLCEDMIRYGKPRAATVIALTDGKIFALDRHIFRRIVMRTHIRRDIIQTLRRVELLNCLSIQQIQRMADLLQECSYMAGEYIIRQGEYGEDFYLIVKGVIDITKNAEVEGEPEMFLVSRREHEYFGERCLLHGEPRAANVIAKTDVKLLRIGKHAFDEVLGPLSEMIDKDRMKREALAARISHAPRIVDTSTCAVATQDNLGPILLGHFNESFSSRSSSKMIKTSDELADKSIRSFILSDVESANLGSAVSNFIEAAKTVTSIEVTNAFIPKLLASWRESNAIHLLFNEPVVGDLSALIRSSSNENSLLTDSPIARYVAACIVSALETLHCNYGIVYRAVQPEGIYVTSAGKVILMDFRVCKVGGVGAKSFTICGASDYLAPEQISQVGHGAPVDFWELGVLLYELTAGNHPFSVGGEVATYSRISSYGTKSFEYLKFPEDLDSQTVSIINKLVVSTPEARLGACANGFQALKKHAFFEGIDWNNLDTMISPLLGMAQMAASDIIKSKSESIDIIKSFSEPYKGSGWDTLIDL
jgi:cGMP-dependent protein kinase